MRYVTNGNHLANKLRISHLNKHVLLSEALATRKNQIFSRRGIRQVAY